MKNYKIYGCQTEFTKNEISEHFNINETNEYAVCVKDFNSKYACFKEGETATIYSVFLSDYLLLRKNLYSIKNINRRSITK